MKKSGVVIIAFIAVLLGFFYINLTKQYNNGSYSSKLQNINSAKQTTKNMNITSPAFTEGKEVPKQYTCEGENFNPPLEFHDVPQNAKSLALIVEDPDAPNGTWYHWFLYNISPDTKGIEPHSKPEEAVEGLANGGTPGYEGPCPPSGIHHYLFTLYALDKMFDLPKTTDAPAFRTAIDSHVLQQATLTGIYNGPAHRLKPL